MRWDGSESKFDSFKEELIGFYLQMGIGYLFDKDFQKDYLKMGVDCFLHHLDEVPSKLQLQKEIQALYGAIKVACGRRNPARSTFIKFNRTKDGI